MKPVNLLVSTGRSIALLLLLFLAVHPSSTSADDKAIGKTALEFVLQDQFEQSWAWTKHWKGKPTVIVMSDRAGSDYTTKWSEPLHTKFKERIQLVAIADVSSVPSFIKGLVRSKFKEAFANSILLDWDGDVCKYYVLQPGIPNVFFLDAQGIVRLHTWGKGAREHVEAFSLNVERILSRP